MNSHSDEYSTLKELGDLFVEEKLDETIADGDSFKEYRKYLAYGMYGYFKWVISMNPY